MEAVKPAFTPDRGKLYVEIAKDQPQYKTLPSLISRRQDERVDVIETEWELDANELAALMATKRIRLTVMKPKGQFFNPVRMEACLPNERRG